MQERRLHVRPARVEDIPAIRTVADSSWRAAYAHIFSTQFIDDWMASAYNLESLRRSVTAEDQLFLLAEMDAAGEAGGLEGDVVSGVVGICHVGRRSPRHDESRSWVLYRLYVRPDAQRRGAGAALLAAAEEWFAGCGARSYHCYVHSRNEIGKSFYLRAGFHRVEAHDHEDEWCMEKELA